MCTKCEIRVTPLSFGQKSSFAQNMTDQIRLCKKKKRIKKRRRKWKEEETKWSETIFQSERGLFTSIFLRRIIQSLYRQAISANQQTIAHSVIHFFFGYLFIFFLFVCLLAIANVLSNHTSVYVFGLQFIQWCPYRVSSRASE